MKEIRLWSKLNHPNILPLFGYLMDGDSPSIISEWMDNGTAKKYVSEHDLTTTDLFDMVSILIDSHGFLSDTEYDLVSWYFKRSRIFAWERDYSLRPEGC